MENSDIFEKLFTWELEEILQKIFLFLDPKSLKNSRSTCNKWKEFIDRRIWKSPSGMLELNRMLISQWKNDKPEMCRSIQLRDLVDSLVCDEKIIAVALCDGEVVAYDSETLDVLYTFPVKGKPQKRIHLDMNEDHLLIICGSILVILDKSTGSKLYRGVPLDLNGLWFSFKMIKNTAVVADDHGHLWFITKSDDSWTVYYKNEPKLRGVAEMVGNDEFLAFFDNFSGISLWDVKKMHLVSSSIDRIKVLVLFRSIAMKYPYVFLVGGENIVVDGGEANFKGLQVYNLETGECIRDYQSNEKGFYEVTTNGRFLTLISDRYTLTTLDIQELINETIQGKDIWMMEHTIDAGLAVANRTKIFVTNGRTLTVFDCWRDRSHDIGRICFSTLIPTAVITGAVFLMKNIFG